MALCFGGDWKESIKDDHPLCFGGDWLESLEDYENKEETTEKFTDGEWVVEHVYMDEGGCLHFTVRCTPRDNGNIHIDGETIQSTAALIAAAPDMYAKLKTVLALCEGGLLRKTRCDILGAEIDQLLKKARGEE